MLNILTINIFKKCLIFWTALIHKITVILYGSVQSKRTELLNELKVYINSSDLVFSIGVPRFTGKTRITGKSAEIPVRPKNNRELKYAFLVLY